MKRGYYSAILPDLTYHQVMEFAATLKMDCVEIACWPSFATTRRYSGITHIDVNALNESTIEGIQRTNEETGVAISALGYYPNPLDPDPEVGAAAIAHIKKCIDAAQLLHVNTVNTFVGRDKDLSVERNLDIFSQIWPDIVAYAAERGVRIGIENCPMYFTADEFPGGNNLAATPPIWRRMFEIIPDTHFGLNYDPSHLIWQQIDYIQPLYEFKDRIFHVHFKDAKIDHAALADGGILEPPLKFHRPNLPGLGDIDFAGFVNALYDINYDRCAVIEVEDRNFEVSLESRMNAVRLSHRYLDQFMV